MDMSIFTPTNLTEAMELSKWIADSDLCPKDYRGKPGNILVCMAKGAELGLQTFQALEGIAVINGRAVIWGDLGVALVRQHPDFVDMDEGFEEETQTAWCLISRRGQTPQRRTFSLAEAQAANLMAKQTPWSGGYAKRMCGWRAKSWAMRDVFADALKGLGIREELAPPPERDITPEPEAPRQLAQSAGGTPPPSTIVGAKGEPLPSKADKVMAKVSRFASMVPVETKIVSAKESAARAKNGFTVTMDQVLFNLQNSMSADDVNLALDSARGLNTEEERKEAHAAAAKRMAELKAAKEGVNVKP